MLTDQLPKGVNLFITQVCGNFWKYVRAFFSIYLQNTKCHLSRDILKFNVAF